MAKLNEKEIIKQVKDLLKNNNTEIKIPVNTIIGIDETNELVYLETISMYKYSDRPTLSVQGMTFRTLSVDEIEERRSEDWADEERDLWVQAVQTGYTDEGLTDWWESACEEAEMEGLLYPYDDDSDRDMIEETYAELPQDFKDEIEAVWGTKGTYREDVDLQEALDESRNSDWFTVYWGSSGSVISRNGHYVGSPNTATERVAGWKVQLYPELIQFLATTIDELAKEKNTLQS